MRINEAQLDPHYAPAQGKAQFSRNVAPCAGRNGGVRLQAWEALSVPETHRQDCSPWTTIREPGPTWIQEEAEAGRAEDGLELVGISLCVGVQTTALALQHAVEHPEAVVEVGPGVEAKTGAQATVGGGRPIEDTLDAGVH